MSRGRWFRQYESTMDDPKVQMLSDWHYRAWNTLLCFASKSGGEFTNDVAVLSFVLRKPVPKVRDTMQVLLSAKLIDATENGYKPHNWDEFQYKSDQSNERVKSFRERSRNVTGNGECNVTVTANVTPPETEQIQIQIQKQSRKNKSRASRFDDFWSLCPKKVGKGKAKQAYLKAISLTSEQSLVDGMALYAKSQIGKDPAFTVHPATWLNQERWTDEPDGGVVIRPSAFNSPEEIENQRRLMEKFNVGQA